MNNPAGCHAGTLTLQILFEELETLGKLLICSGGIGNEQDLAATLKIIYAGVQMGTRFIASTECRAHDDYKQAIVKAQEQDIVLTDKIISVPAAITNTHYIERMGTKAGSLARMLRRNGKTKHCLRMFYTLQSIWKPKKASLQVWDTKTIARRARASSESKKSRWR